MLGPKWARALQPFHLMIRPLGHSHLVDGIFFIEFLVITSQKVELGQICSKSHVSFLQIGGKCEWLFDGNSFRLRASFKTSIGRRRKGLV